MEIFISHLRKISSRNLSSSSGLSRNPAPLPFVTTVFDGQPRFRFTSLYPYSCRVSAVWIKSSAFFVRIWGTAYIPSLFSGIMSFFSLVLRCPFWFGRIKGIKYLSKPPKHWYSALLYVYPVIPSRGAKYIFMCFSCCIVFKRIKSSTSLCSSTPDNC